MKERPIQFNEKMVQALLNGEKTVTRRVVKKEVMFRGDDFLPWYIRRDGLWDNYRTMTELVEKHCPYGRVKDRLWVRETWATHHSMDHVRPSEIEPGNAVIFYRATDRCLQCKYRPSIHMPRWMSRITLQITGVDLERVQDMTEAEAIAEGIDVYSHGGAGHNYAVGGVTTRDPLHAFSVLWDEINAKRGPWNDNPWVWVVRFRSVYRRV